MRGTQFDADARVAWLLRRWRLAARPGGTAKSFADELRQADVSADASRVSRWETAQLTAGLDVVAGYERVLGTPRGMLCATALALRRQPSVGGGSEPAFGVRFSPERLEQAFDAVENEPTGADWLELAGLVASRPSHVTLPTSLWHRYSTSLVTETGLSVGAAYLTRFEAAVLLSRHPTARVALVRRIGRHVTDPSSQLVIEPLSMLTEPRDSRANSLILRLLESADGAVLDAAVYVAGVLQSRGYLDTHEQLRLERAVIELSRRHGLEVGSPIGNALDLIRTLSPAAQSRVATHLGAALTQARQRAQPEEPPTGKGIGAYLTQSLTLDDKNLALVTEEALLHEDAGRRFSAGTLLMASPFKDMLGERIATELHSHLDGDSSVIDLPLATRMMTLLTLVAPASGQPLLRRILDGQEGPHLRTALAVAAHLPTPDVRLDLQPAIMSEDPAVSRAALYAAGMTGHPCLKTVADDEALPDQMREAARWWISEGPAIHEPAVQR